MMAGIVVIALPVTLIGSNFVEEYRKTQAREAAEKRKQAAVKRAIERLACKRRCVWKGKKNADGGGGGARGTPGTPPPALSREKSATMTGGQGTHEHARARKREAASDDSFTGGLPWDPSPGGGREVGAGFSAVEVCDRLDAVERRMFRIENLLSELLAASAAKA